MITLCLASARGDTGPVHEATSVLEQGIEKEYSELDTVWFMAGSLFGNYPYDTPTDAFPLKLFREVRQ